MLADSADLFKWQPGLSDLRDHAVFNSQKSFSVRFLQWFKDVVPVDASEVVVNIDATGRVYSIYNNYRYDIPQQLDPKKIKMNSEQAQEMARRLLERYERSELRDTKLIVYQYHEEEHQPHKPPPASPEVRIAFIEAVRAQTASIRADNAKEGQYFLAWEIIATTLRPQNAWRILIDAISGRVIQVIDTLQYATGSGQVFDPNPTVTTGDLSLSGSTPTATLDAQRKAVTLERLNPAAGGNSGRMRTTALVRP